MLTDQSIRDLLAAFQAPTSVPAGGSASALASAVGASLLMMVAALPKTRSGSNEDRKILAAALLALTGLQPELTEAIDADAAAYAQVAGARKLPRTTDAEAAARKAAVERTLHAATAVPLDVMRLSSLALKQAPGVAERGHRAASSDARVAIALLRAGFEGARSSVQSNLDGLTDAAFVEAVKVEVGQLCTTAREAADAAERSLLNA